MYNPRKKILWFAIGSRLTIFVLQFIFNILYPDHESDGFRSPVDTTTSISPFDELIVFIFGGLTRWDGEYFIHIAKYGYTYENTLAFYPLFPLTIRIIVIFVKKIFFMLNFHSCIIVAGVLLNFICFIKSALVFYDLSRTVLKLESVAYKATILYCINPASIFFSALYTESLFAYLTFYSMLASIKRSSFVSFPVALSMLVRSNGIINLGFPVYMQLRDLWHSFFIKYSKCSFLVFCRFIFDIGTLQSILSLLNTIVISLAPVILLQIYNYASFCVPRSNQEPLPINVIHYGESRNLLLQGSGTAEWCNSSLPLAYSYVQKKYWNVGFLSYYNFKQIPNFLLAFPILYIMISSVKEYISEHKKYFYTLGLSENIKDDQLHNVKKYPKEMFVFVIHGMFLTIFCIFFVHIQVSTRLLSSASPLLYWYCALTMSHNKQPYKNLNKTQCDSVEQFSKWRIPFLTQRKYFFIDKLILYYFLGYTIVGCFMFSNFLPWT